MQQQQIQKDLTTSHLKDESTDQHFEEWIEIFCSQNNSTKQGWKAMFSIIVEMQSSLQHPGWSQADFSITVRADLINDSLMSFSVAVVTAAASS